MSEEMLIGPGPRCPHCGEDYGQHTPDCYIAVKRKRMVGEPVTKEYVAKELGFTSVEEMDLYYAELKKNP